MERYLRQAIRHRIKETYWNIAFGAVAAIVYGIHRHRLTSFLLFLAGWVLFEIFRQSCFTIYYVVKQRRIDKFFAATQVTRPNVYLDLDEFQ